jgi:hypothetical protein
MDRVLQLWARNATRTEGAVYTWSIASQHGFTFDGLLTKMVIRY